MYMNDIKLFAKIEKKVKILIETVRIYIQEIGEISHRKIYRDNNEKREMTNDIRNRIQN